jgi:ribonucleotide monophosphatase NagD (HAD superfamily)
MPRPPAPRAPDRLYAAYLFDLDGTIYLGDELLPGAGRLIGALRELGLPVRFLSNNPTSDPEQYAAKLTRLGLPTPAGEIVNTVVTMTRWLLEHAPGAVVTDRRGPLHRALSGPASAPPATRPRSTWWWPATTAASPTRAPDRLRRHLVPPPARLVATNRTATALPGRPRRARLRRHRRAIEACTGVVCGTTTGKPDPAMLEAALAGLGWRRPTA